MLLQGRFAVWTVKNKVETSFDETEFLEGAKDAWVAGAFADMCVGVCAVCHLKQSVIHLPACMEHLLHFACFALMNCKSVTSLHFCTGKEPVYIVAWRLTTCQAKCSAVICMFSCDGIYCQSNMYCVAVNSCMNHNDVEMLKDMVHPHLMDTFRSACWLCSWQHSTFLSRLLQFEWAS